jgi:type II secretory ATPase GspE/PulE/Tfp pilus assembly ATPase PilB-like protein
MAQRLIRVLHADCKQPDPAPDPKYLRLIGLDPAQAQGKVYKNVGCAGCVNTGYRGRKAIFEMMLMNSKLRDLAFKKATVTELQAAAKQSGMKTLVDDGRLKVLAGATTPAEIARMAQEGH